MYPSPKPRKTVAVAVLTAIAMLAFHVSDPVTAQAVASAIASLFGATN